MPRAVRSKASKASKASAVPPDRPRPAQARRKKRTAARVGQTPLASVSTSPAHAIPPPPPCVHAMHDVLLLCLSAGSGCSQRTGAEHCSATKLAVEATRSPTAAGLDKQREADTSEGTRLRMRQRSTGAQEATTATAQQSQAPSAAESVATIVLPAPAPAPPPSAAQELPQALPDALATTAAPLMAAMTAPPAATSASAADLRHQFRHASLPHRRGNRFASCSSDDSSHSNVWEHAVSFASDASASGSETDAEQENGAWLSTDDGSMGAVEAISGTDRCKALRRLIAARRGLRLHGVEPVSTTAVARTAGGPAGRAPTSTAVQAATQPAPSLWSLSEPCQAAVSMGQPNSLPPAQGALLAWSSGTGAPSTKGSANAAIGEVRAVAITENAAALCWAQCCHSSMVRTGMCECPAILPRHDRCAAGAGLWHRWRLCRAIRCASAAGWFTGAGGAAARPRMDVGPSAPASAATISQAGRCCSNPRLGTARHMFSQCKNSTVHVHRSALPLPEHSHRGARHTTRMRM